MSVIFKTKGSVKIVCRNPDCIKYEMVTTKKLLGKYTLIGGSPICNYCGWIMSWVFIPFDKGGSKK